MAYQAILGMGSRNVTTAGTQLPLVATPTFVRSLVIQARRGNTQAVYIGTSAIDNATGISLLAGETLAYDGPRDKHGVSSTFNLADIYVDSNVNGEGVTFIYSVDSYNQHTF